MPPPSHLPEASRDLVLVRAAAAGEQEIDLLIEERLVYDKLGSRFQLTTVTHYRQSRLFDIVRRLEVVRPILPARVLTASRHDNRSGRLTHSSKSVLSTTSEGDSKLRPEVSRTQGRAVQIYRSGTFASSMRGRLLPTVLCFLLSISEKSVRSVSNTYHPNRRTLRPLSAQGHPLSA